MYRRVLNEGELQDFPNLSRSYWIYFTGSCILTQDIMYDRHMLMKIECS